MLLIVLLISYSIYIIYFICSTTLSHLYSTRFLTTKSVQTMPSGGSLHYKLTMCLLFTVNNIFFIPRPILEISVSLMFMFSRLHSFSDHIEVSSFFRPHLPLTFRAPLFLPSTLTSPSLVNLVA